MAILSKISAPQTALLSLAEVKQQCRVDFDDDDLLLSSLIQAATDHLDGWSGILGRCLISQSWLQRFSHWRGSFRLGFPDVQSITSVKYYDSDDVLQTVSADDYQLFDNEMASSVDFLSSFLAPSLSGDKVHPIEITFVAGYGDSASDVPQSIRQAALMLIAHWYDTRHAVADKVMTSVPMAFDALTAPHRRFGF